MIPRMPAGTAVCCIQENAQISNDFDRSFDSGMSKNLLGKSIVYILYTIQNIEKFYLGLWFGTISIKAKLALRLIFKRLATAQTLS